ncbi:cadherin-related family member 4-like [Ochotona princeps]|uniref:cadherin-related family member 4-like n=1 Tax=Ochotona princeps TaxID=9978 RepID=UPI002714DF0F|nr:cadherin-related family member 4-like [Ochotona princeps]
MAETSRTQVYMQNRDKAVRVSPHTVAEIQILINPVNLPENLLPGTQLSRAYDKDVAGRPNAYRFLNKTNDFNIDAGSGVITATKVFNYESDPIKFLLIVDSGGLQRRVLMVNILDVPERPDCTADPQFSSGTATVELPEDFPPFQSIYRVTATDEDFANGDLLKYTVETQISGPKRGAKCFDVDPVTGVVSVNGEDSLDFDAGHHVFQLALRATDTRGLFCQGSLIIRIQNVNDEKPQFEPFPLDVINVTEKKPVGEMITRVKATDRDGVGSITYSFKTRQEVFGLDPFTGIISLLRPLDLDESSKSKMYPLEVEARDDGNHTGTYAFTVIVQNVDDPISCDPSFSNGAGVSVTVPENTRASTPIYTILSRDPHGQMEVSLFKLVISARSREDLSAESCTGTIWINIQNINDETPVFTYIPDQPINIYENLPVGTEMIKLTATDNDLGDSVHYEFIGTPKEFSIHEDSGAVTVSYPLDYEDADTPKYWVLYFRAYDNERMHSTTGTLTVILQDVNDNRPQCSQDIYVIELPENIPVETLLASLTCTDKDGTAPNNNITYHLVTDSFSNETFTLRNNELKIGPAHLDYDNAIFAGMHFKYTIFVKVSDGGNPTLSTIIIVILRVTRINELNPTGINSEFTFSILENSPVETLVGKITFTDSDWPFNNVKYSIVGGNLGTPPKFYIEPDTGMIKLLDSLDREMQSQYKLTVTVTDLDNDALPDPLRQRSASAQVTIDVLNVNDEPPVCTPPHLEIQIYSTVKIPFIQLNCSDKDSPQQHLSYSILRGNTNNRFTLWRRAAEPPSLAATPNFQGDVFQDILTPMTFQLLIEVTDELGGNKARQLSATTTVIIHVFPWTITQPTSSTKPAPTTVTTSVLMKISYYWSPDNWIPAVLTLTGVLFLACLYAVAWCLFKDVAACSRLFPHCREHQQNQPSLGTAESGKAIR